MALSLHAPEPAPSLRLHQPDAADRCPHCRERAAQHDRRKLCSRCFKDPGVRNAVGADGRLLYPADPRGNRMEADLPAGVLPPLPARPTTAAPNTPRKRGVLRYRAGRTLQLHHPYDPRIAPASSAVQKARALFAALMGLNAEVEDD